MDLVLHFGFDHETVSVTRFVTYPIYLPLDLAKFPKKLQKDGLCGCPSRIVPSPMSHLCHIIRYPVLQNVRIPWRHFHFHGEEEEDKDQRNRRRRSTMISGDLFG